jgi:hypothetical protein
MMHRNTRHYDGETLIEETFRDVEWDEVRRLRDLDLERCDWRALKDVTLSAAWRDYRQALRDLPQNHEDANSACDAWPQPPE